MKKIIAVLAVVLLLTSFTGCVSDSPKEGDTRDSYKFGTFKKNGTQIFKDGQWTVQD